MQRDIDQNSQVIKELKTTSEENKELKDLVKQMKIQLKKYEKSDQMV